MDESSGKIIFSYRELKEGDNDMWFKIDANGIEIKFQINNYKPANRDYWDQEWCKCDFSFVSGDWLNYHRENDEILLCCEIEDLAEAFTELLDDKNSEIKEIKCVEPDFVFKLCPQIDLREDSKYVYICPGYEIQDIYVEWKIYFWNDGLTDNYLTIILERNDIVRFRDYLEAVMKNS